MSIGTDCSGITIGQSSITTTINGKITYNTQNVVSNVSDMTFIGAVYGFRVTEVSDAGGTAQTIASLTGFPTGVYFISFVLNVYVSVSTNWSFLTHTGWGLYINTSYVSYPYAQIFSGYPGMLSASTMLHFTSTTNAVTCIVESSGRSNNGRWNVRNDSAYCYVYRIA
jgi:hypothetical protein